MFNETLLNMLQAISDTRGFVMFCLAIAVAYATIWALFLFEAPVKKKKPKKGEGSETEGEDAEGGEQKGQKGKKKPAEKSAPKKQKQAA